MSLGDFSVVQEILSVHLFRKSKELSEDKSFSKLPRSFNMF